MFANLVPVPPVAPATVADIIFYNPTKKYFAGDTVSGKVIFTTIEPIPARFIRISWNGSAKCDWPGIDYDSTKKYLKNEIMAWISPDGKNELPAGIHKFRFSFPLPADCPPSFAGPFGEISYNLTVELDRPWQWNIQTVKNFYVIQKTCLAVSAPKMLKNATFSKHKNSGTILRDGVFTMKISLLKRAFLPGEVIKALVTLENLSSKPICQLDFQLLQQSHYHSRPQSTHCSLNNCLEDCPVPQKYRRDTESVVCCGTLQRTVAPFQTKQLVIEIKVPSKLPATFESSMISMGYMIGFSARNTSFTNNKLSIYIRIMIGNEEKIDENGDGRGFKPVDSLPPPPPPPYSP